jgi:hypothetical protein
MPAGFGKFAAALTCVGALIALAGIAAGAERGVANSALAQAARDARLDQIDAFRKQCGDDRRVADWLKDVVGDTAKSIQWSGGRCRLTNKLNPLDGGTNWCGQAVITLKRGQHKATIEVFFEKPAHGKAGVPFAFRAIADTKDGPDYMRETFGFEVNWKQMHVPGYVPPSNQDCD